MAKFRFTFVGDGEAQERVVTAPSREDALELFNTGAGVGFEIIENLVIKKIAEIAATSDEVPAKAKASSGRNKVAGVVKGKLARLELATRSGKPVWPQRGKPHAGMQPGKWREDDPKDETGCLPHDCPVRPLGYEGENFYFVDTMGQVFNSQGKAVGVERMQILFAGQEDFLSWAWPSMSAKGEVTGFKTEEARRDLYAAIAKRGPWSPTDMVRGRGAWTDSQGRLVLHCGEHLIIDGQMEETGEYDGHFYPRRPAVASPWGEAVEEVADNPAITLFKSFRTWTWARGDIDCMLFLGWIGVGMMSGALDWRPSAFILGDAGTGKSELHKLLKAIFARLMISTTNATEAGLYQLVGHDSLPIAIDELEGEDGQAQAAKIIKMARDAASGSIRIRGGADHKGVEFAARSAFLFSAINPPPLPPASLTRLAVLQLRALENTAAEPPLIEAAETIAPKLLRRIVDHWQDFPNLYDSYRKALREKGNHDSRGQDTFGSFLAAAHLLLGDEGMAALGLPFESLDLYGISLAASAAPELEGRQANWMRCLEAILTAKPDVWRGGEQRSVGQLLELMDKGLDDYGQVGAALAQADLGILKPGIAGGGFGLAIPNNSRTLGKLLADTSFGSPSGAGNWSFALKQAPETIVFGKVAMRGDDVLDNRMSIAGVQRRCTFVGLKELREWMETNG